MLQRIAIPDLAGGVSRQPDSRRFANQVEECTNTLLHLAQGLEKRPGFEMVKDLTNISGDLYVHWINRSTTERYAVIFKNDATTPVTIYRIDGTACTINWIDAAAKTYATTAVSNLRMITVDDTTILVNSSITTALSSSTSPGYATVDQNGSANNRDSWELFDLPPAGVGVFYYAKDDALGHPAGWYESLSTTVQPWYKRVRSPHALSVFDADTMPIRIIQTGATTFEGRLIEWAPRYTGDSDTNPPPSFTGKKITDLCLHRNRLWFSAGESVIGSQTGDYYNFFLNSYSSVVDSDPVDISIGSAEVATISWMAPFAKQIVVFTTSGAQYEISAKEAMSPTTVNVTPSTTYASPMTRPAIVGSQLYWIAPKGPYAQMFEYITDESTAQSVATDAASHVDRYIPSTVVNLTASSSNDVIVCRDGTDIYANFMFWQGDKKIQNSWCKWTLGHVDDLIGMNVYDDYLYVIVREVTTAATTMRIDRMSLRHADPVHPDYIPRMDNLVKVSGTYSGATRTTTFTVPFNVDDLDTMYLGTEYPTQSGSRLATESCTPVAINNTTVVVNGKYDTADVYLGTSFDMSVELSRQYIRDQNSVPAVGTLQLKQLTVYHRNTGFFALEIDPKTEPSSTRVWKYTGKQLGSVGFILNRNVISDNDSQNFKIMASSGGVDLRLTSDSPAPVNITALEFVGDFVVSKRSAAST